jgi:hypothetical protein
VKLWWTAIDLLSGVGDAKFGEWRETGDLAVHLRRRVTAEEWGERPWGMDYRGTEEGERRLAGVRAWLPKDYKE